MQFINATVYLEEKIIPCGFVEIQNGRITAVGDMAGLELDDSPVDLSGSIIAPGFIDQHIHGAGGADVMDATPEALNTIAKYLVCEGTTSFLATTMTMPSENIHRALKNVANYKSKQACSNGAELLGVHLEGPFINTLFKGAHNEKYITQPDIKLFNSFQESAGNSIKLVTFAVENDPRHNFLRNLRQSGVIPSCGHSAANYAETQECTVEGLSCLTHFHNAMSGHHQRNPGVVTAGFCLDNLKTEVIADGIHLHPGVLRMIYQVKGKDAIILITDGICAKGLADGFYELGERTVNKTGMKCSLTSGELAGSVLPMDTAVRNMVKFSGCSLYDAVQMASLNPARLLGVDNRKGSIALGKDADLVILDNEGNLQMTIVRGQVVS